MASPVFVSSTWYDNGNVSGNGWIPFALLDLSAFNVAIFVAGISGNNTMSVAIGSSAGWTLLTSNQSITSGLSTTGQFAIFYKLNPTANETLQIAASGAIVSSLIGGYLIGVTGADSVTAKTSTKSSGSGSADPNPPSNDGGAVRDYLWLAVAGNRSTSITPSAAPSGYSNFTVHSGQTQAAGIIPGVAFATLQTNNQTEDPGVFTQASTPWCTFTFGLYSNANNYSQSLAADCAVTSALGLGAGKGLAAAVDAPATMARSASHALAGTAAGTARLAIAGTRSFLGSTSTIGAVAVAAGRGFLTMVAGAASVARDAGCRFVPAVTVTPALSAGPAVALNASGAAVPTIARSNAVSLLVSLTLLPALWSLLSIGFRAIAGPAPSMGVGAGTALAARVDALPTLAPGVLQRFMAPVAVVAFVQSTFSILIRAAVTVLPGMVARLFHLPEACRIIDVAAEDRTLIVAAEERTIYVDSCEPKLYSFPARYTPESKGYGVDWSRRLATGVTIVTAEAFMLSGDLDVTPAAWNGGNVTFRLSGGTPVYQRLAVRVTLSDGDIQQIEATIACYP